MIKLIIFLTILAMTSLSYASETKPAYDVPDIFGISLTEDSTKNQAIKSWL